MSTVSSADRSAALHTLAEHRRPTVPARAAATVTPPADVRILLCQPAPLAGEAIAATLRRRPGIAQVAVVTSATALVRELSSRWDVALVSETMGPDLPELLQALAFRGHALPVVVMTTDASPDVAAGYLEWGAAGSVDVRRPVSVLLQAVAVAGSGAPVVDDRIEAAIVERLRERAAHRENARAVLRSLTPRERQVMESLARGTGVTAIASGLHLSPHTVRACIRSIGPKLRVAGQMQIASVARQLLSVELQPAPSRHLMRVRASVTASMPLSG